LIAIFDISPETQFEAVFTQNLVAGVTGALFVGLVYFTVAQAVEPNDAKNRGARMEDRREVVASLKEVAIHFFYIRYHAYAGDEGHSLFRSAAQFQIMWDDRQQAGGWR
jgi:hypothetical protein